MKILKVFGIALASVFLITGSVRVIESASVGGRVFFVLAISLVIVFCIRYWMRRIQNMRARESSLAHQASEVLRDHLSESAVRDKPVEAVERDDRADLDGDEEASVRSRTKLLRLELTYTNTRDLTQQRLVLPYRSGANMDYFDAWCFMEDVRRSFSFYRVQYAINPETGELLSQAGLYRLIHPKRKAPPWLKESIP
jgi:hypothetical protein